MTGSFFLLALVTGMTSAAAVFEGQFDRERRPAAAHDVEACHFGGQRVHQIEVLLDRDAPRFFLAYPGIAGKMKMRAALIFNAIL
jgi:hypothetical protein